MTTPAPGLVTGSFAGTLTPAQVWALLNALIEGSPFAVQPDQGTDRDRQDGIPHGRAHRVRLA